MNDTPAPCPVCGRPGVRRDGPDGRLAPFCCVRCADVDLGRWFTGRYSIPVKPDPEVDPSDTLG
jgi:endogenous inhibitor of DNA gyrase (YacG/DUF329 family)